MAQTTGPVLLMGGITLANQSLFHDKPIEWRIPIATGLAAGFFALGEKVFPKAVPMLAWVALAGVLLSRTDPAIPSPAESFVDWWQKK